MYNYDFSSLLCICFSSSYFFHLNKNENIFLTHQILKIIFKTFTPSLAPGQLELPFTI